MEKKNCGNCDNCEKEGGDLVCANGDSEYVAGFVEENHTCDDWEGNTEE